MSQRGRLNRWVGRLINRRLVLWLWSLVIIAILLAALGAIFWMTRMKATYEVEARTEWEGETFVVFIPWEPLQKIVAGDPVAIDLGGGGTAAGSVRSVAERGEEIEAVIELKPTEKITLPPRVRITLRARRLLSAFRRGGGG